jgi:putative sugar O-methyltransferase
MKNFETEKYFDLAALDAGLLPLSKEVESGPGNDLLLKRLQQFYISNKENQGSQLEIYQPAGEWQEHVNHRMPHYQAFYDDSTDRLNDLLCNFWRNELGVLVKQYAGYKELIGDARQREEYVRLMAYDLMIWSNLFGANVTDLQIPNVGNPWGYLWEGTLIGSKLLRYHTIVTQINGIVADIDRPVIAEIGAGYCGVGYYLMKDDNPCVYINFDLPETLAVGAYYLSKTLPDRSIYLHEGGPIDWSNLLENYDVIMMPNWAIDNLPESSVDVFLNTFSLSEMSKPVIEQYLLKISYACKNYFLHNNMDRENVINEGFKRTPASKYPFPPNTFKCLYKKYDLFIQKHSGRDGDYREYLYQKISN